jgi:hypothetical protein
MKIYDSAAVSGMSFHDSTILGISWRNGQEDLVFFLEWLPRAGLGLPLMPTQAELMFSFSTDLVIEVRWEGSMGAPSIYESSFLELPHGRWSVEFAFSGIPEGVIRFECNSMNLSTISSTEAE